MRPDPNAALLFDSDCAFCDGSMRWIWRMDRDGRFVFVPIRSKSGRTLLVANGFPADFIGSFVLVDESGAWTRSTALSRLMRLLPILRPLAPALDALPRSARDAAYDALARNRYRLFGRRSSCTPPPADFRARLVDDPERLPANLTNRMATT